MKLKKIKPSFIRKDDRGIFAEALNGTSWKSISFGKMNEGAVMGNHYHKLATVFFFIISGKAKIDSIDIKSKETCTILLNDGEGILFPSYVSHAISFQKDSTFVMGKSKKYDLKNNDTYKYIVAGNK